VVTLTAEQIERLVAATHTLQNPVRGAAIRFLLLTGARQGETLKAAWTQMDLAVGVWTKPAASTKQKRVHHLPLSLPQWRSCAACRATGRRSSLPRTAPRCAT